MDDLLTYWLDRLDRDRDSDAELVLTELFVHTDTEGRPCPCSCHPSLGSPDQQGDDGCPCAHSPERHRARMTSWFEELEAERARWKESDEGKAESARRAAEAAELEAWVDTDPGVDVSSWGGCLSEQWTGTIDSHSFYFREKHGHWSIEIDLEPTGDTYRRLVLDAESPGGDDARHTVEEQIERGVIIAEGWDRDPGVTPLQHGRFVVNTVRAHLRREGCSHPGARRYYPECGAAARRRLIPSTGSRPMGARGVRCDPRDQPRRNGPNPAGSVRF